MPATNWIRPGVSKTKRSELRSIAKGGAARNS